jgi:hypothetical protein
MSFLIFSKLILRSFGKFLQLYGQAGGRAARKRTDEIYLILTGEIEYNCH